MRIKSLRTAAMALGLAAIAGPAAAQWTRVHEQFYLPASHNWQFRRNYSAADRLFNAFDYGHAILYEELYTRPGAPVERLEQKEFDFLTRKLLVNPPRVPLEEGAIEIAYAKLAPEAKAMFHWAHILHRQVYDAWADERLSPAQKDAAIAEILRYYKSRPEYAFSSVPKSMDIMDAQPFSLAFRQKYPKFNGLIWAYHWLQVGLYEPLIVGSNLQERKAGIQATVGRFWQLIEGAPTNMPYLMPMTAAVAPEFSRRYPEVAIIFDNLHMMHDVISDILASNKVPREQKRAEILRQVRMFRDDTSYVTTRDEWFAMAEMMGINNMGGPAVGFLAALPQPTVARGASMAGMDHSQMGGQHTGGQHQGHGQSQPGTPAMDHAGMHHEHSPTAPMQHAGGMDMQGMMQMHMRMMQNPAIHRQVMQDTALHRMMMEHMQHMPAEDRARMHQMMHGPGHSGHEASPVRKAAPARTKQPAARKATPAPKKADPHAGHGTAKTPAKKPAAKPASKPTAAKPKPPAKPKDPHAGHHMPPPHKHR